MLNNVLEFASLLIINKMPFTLRYSKNEKAIIWVPNKHMRYVNCRIKQTVDGTYGFLSNFTTPKIISDGLTLEEAFEMAKEHYNH